MIEKKADILLVDDTPNNLRLLSGILTESGYKVRLAPNGNRAITAVQKQSPDIILLDILMPDISGYEVCRMLKRDPSTSDIPVLFISALDDEIEKTKAFAAGGLDYITKPFHENEVLARIRTHLDLKQSKDKLVSYIGQLEKVNRELEQAKQELTVMASTDPLTGLYNRRKSLEVMEAEQVRAKRSKTSFTVAIADIDDFKNINDSYGHDAGDFILKSVATDIQSMIRSQDHLGRWGGEEFIMILPETDISGAKTIINKIRQNIIDTTHRYNDNEISVSMTFGLAAQEQSSDTDLLINCADMALYEGKKAGKNRVVCYK